MNPVAGRFGDTPLGGRPKRTPIHPDGPAETRKEVPILFRCGVSKGLPDPLVVYERGRFFAVDLHQVHPCREAVAGFQRPRCVPQAFDPPARNAHAGTKAGADSTRLDLDANESLPPPADEVDLGFLGHEASTEDAVALPLQKAPGQRLAGASHQLRIARMSQDPTWAKARENSSAGPADSPAV